MTAMSTRAGRAGPRTESWSFLAARYLVLVSAVGAVVWFGAGVPASFRLFRDAAASSEIFGLTPAGYAVVSVGIDALFVALCAAVGGIVWRRRTDDPMALLTMFALVVWGVANGLVVYTSEGLVRAGAGGVWPHLYLAMSVSGYVAWMLFLYLFPTFSFVPRWTRWTAVAWVAFILGFAVFLGTPLEPANWPPWIFGPVVLSLWASFVVAQVVRYRRVSSPEQRQQTKWVVFGIGVAIAGLLPSALGIGTVFDIPLDEPGRHLAAQALSVGFVAVIPATVGMAVLRRRLYDIDIVVNRTIVFGIMTALVVGGYALAVAGIGYLFGAETTFLSSVVAAGLVAVSFQPLLIRVRRVVSRRLFGLRDDPAQMLSGLARHLAAGTPGEDPLHDIATAVRAGLRLPYVELAFDDGLADRHVIVGEPIGSPVEIPVRFQEAVVGRMVVTSRSSGEPLTQSELSLLETIGTLAGITSRAVQHSEQIRDSRREIVAGREEERRRLRRDIHDGLGPLLAAIKLQAETARDLMDTPAASHVSEIVSLAASAVDDVRNLVRGLRPPALDELGLVGALRAAVSDTAVAIEVVIEAAEPIDLPAAVEVGAYHICREAITNAARHSGGDRCVVKISMGDDMMLSVCDNGTGIDPDAAIGVGMVSMRERCEELGGRLDISTGPKRGTCVEARLPLSGRTYAR